MTSSRPVLINANIKIHFDSFEQPVSLVRHKKAVSFSLMLTWIARRASIIPRIGRHGPSNDQLTGFGLAFGQHTDAAALWIVDDAPALVPVDEGGRRRCLERHTCQIDVAATFDEQLGVAQNFRLWYCCACRVVCVWFGAKETRKRRKIEEIYILMDLVFFFIQHFH